MPRHSANDNHRSTNPKASQPMTPVLVDIAHPSKPLSPKTPSPITLPSSSLTTATTEPHPNQFLLPIPTTPNSKSQPSFAFAEGTSGEHHVTDPLPPEIASADISIAPDGSFVETSSGPAARELKRRYDHQYGVGKDVRSPYAITAFVNQHGKPMYRIGHRELSPPGAAAAGVEELISAKSSSSASPRAQNAQSSTQSHGVRPRRPSRMSVHTLLHPSMFKHGGGKNGSGGGGGPVHEQQPPAVTHPSAPGSGRKLRRTRSIPDNLPSGAHDLSSSPTQQHPGGDQVISRGHSHSVTAADLPTLPIMGAPIDQTPNKITSDVFCEVMQWPLPPTRESASFLPHASFVPVENPRGRKNSVYSRTPVLGQRVSYPFGPGVSFDSPSLTLLQRESTLSTPTPPLLEHHLPLRSMHSSDSVMTARQVNVSGDKPVLPTPGRLDLVLDIGPLSFPSFLSATEETKQKEKECQPDGGLHTKGVEQEQKLEESRFGPSPETSIHSRYSTDVFDVLQTYRGLPQLDKLASSDTTIKMSLAADETAAPKNDPRFVIWGDVHPTQHEDDGSVSHGSHPDAGGGSGPSSNASWKRRGKSVIHHVDVPSLRVGNVLDGQRMLLAATIERWIAQLTSDLNYDELLTFFLTYRTYISAVDLCHLLICRFHWALLQPLSPQDEAVRRIVRVRTFVALRYWLLTFFVVDFLGNRELRLLLASWINTLIKDPVLKKHSDGLSTVRKLKKIVQDCKKAHTRTSPPERPPSDKPRPKVSHVLGEKFAEATRSSFDDDSDVDLDFGPDQAVTSPGSLFQGDPVNAHLTTHIGSGLSPAAGAPALTILQQSRVAVVPGVDIPFVQSAATLPVHHSALSRAFVNTIGRLGRWKRVLNSRTGVPRAPIGVCADVSAFDLELSVSRDLLTVNGGVEQYLKMIEPKSNASPLRVHPRESAILSPSTSDYPSPKTVVAPKLPASPTATLPVLSPATPPAIPPATLPTTLHTTPPATPPATLHVTSLAPTPAPVTSPPPLTVSKKELEKSSERHPELSTLPFPSETPKFEPVFPPSQQLKASASIIVDDIEATVEKSRAGKDADAVSFSSSSTGSLGVPIASRFTVASRTSHRPPWQFDIVSIDDLDLSDTSSDGQLAEPTAPPGLRKVGNKRLPLRRDFEFVKRPESVSSLGIPSHRSVASASSSAASAPSSMVLGGDIQQWQVNALVDSLSHEEEPGDVEEALRRLEGQINPVKQQEKASKVDGWVRTIRERLAAGDYIDEPPRFMDDDDEEEERPEDEAPSHWSGDDLAPPSASVSQRGSVSSQDLAAFGEVELQVARQVHNKQAQASGPPSPVRSITAKPALEDAVPSEILQSRVISHQQTLNGFGEPITFNPSNIPQIHHSFVLDFRAEVILKHFSMIDRELFMNIKFEELVLDDWMNREALDVHDWVQFLKDRARWKAEHRFPHKTSALAAVRARFNLVAKFTISEVVLTHPNLRTEVVAKLIRIAWKAYCMSNFNTLVAIIAGLCSEWVSKAMRRLWSRVGIWEMRVFRDLKTYTTNADDFKYIRLAIESMVEAKPPDQSSRTVSAATGTDSQSGKSRLLDGKVAVSFACIPFIGVYLSQLHRLSKISDLVDPTAPHEAVTIDPITANFNTPAHPEIFDSLTPLPPSMQLEPLINVHKQRLIAEIIKSLVAGQHLASRVQFPVDKKLYQRCLRLRGLDLEMLHRALAMYPD